MPFMRRHTFQGLQEPAMMAFAPFLAEAIPLSRASSTKVMEAQTGHLR